jgi:hypothetical protein
MFCPSCKDEFRAGFTRCASCGVDLVESLHAAAPAAGPRRLSPQQASLRMVDFCGFFSLDEARAARDRLREDGIRSEITIRESAGADLHEAIDEEYWLRVDASRFEGAAGILGWAEADDGDEAPACSDCGAAVDEEAARCPSCGASFE